MTLSENFGQPFPLEIDYHPDDTACVSAALAFLMFRIDAPQELWQPNAMDAITGREPGGITYNEDAGYLALMDQGTKVTSILAFDRKRFLSEGLNYLEEYHADKWLKDTPDAFYEYWKPDRLATQQQFAADLLEGVKAFGDQWKEISEHPSVELLTDLPGANTSLLVPTNRKEPNIYHSVVVTRFDPGDEGATQEGSFVTFDNQYQPPITTFREKYFKKALFKLASGLIVMQKPTN